MSKQIVVSDEVHAELMGMKGQLMAMGKKELTLDDVLRILLKMPEEEE